MVGWGEGQDHCSDGRRFLFAAPMANPKDLQAQATVHAMRGASSHHLFDRQGAPLHVKCGPTGALEAGLTHIPGTCRRSGNLQALSGHMTSPGSDTNQVRGIFSFTNKGAVWVRVGRGPARAPPHRQRKQRIACNASLLKPSASKYQKIAVLSSRTARDPQCTNVLVNSHILSTTSWRNADSEWLGLK